jgi:hypothetical protein
VLVGGAVVAVALIAGGVGYGLSGGSSDHSTPAAATSHAPRDHERGHHRRPHAIVGTVSAENGNTWTVTKADGSTVTVTVTGDTRFGTRANPENAAQFPVGAKVVVRGHATDGAVTARWIGKPTDLQAKRAQPPVQPPQPGQPDQPPQPGQQPPAPTN